MVRLRWTAQKMVLLWFLPRQKAKNVSAAGKSCLMWAAIRIRAHAAAVMVPWPRDILRNGADGFCIGSGFLGALNI